MFFGGILCKPEQNAALLFQGSTKSWVESLKHLKEKVDSTWPLYQNLTDADAKEVEKFKMPEGFHTKSQVFHVLKGKDSAAKSDVALLGDNVQKTGASLELLHVLVRTICFINLFARNGRTCAGGVDRNCLHLTIDFQGKVGFVGNYVVTDLAWLNHCYKALVKVPDNLPKSTENELGIVKPGSGFWTREKFLSKFANKEVSFFGRRDIAHK